MQEFQSRYTSKKETNNCASFKETRLKCKSSARVKIVLKKDWIVKKSFQKLKNVEKYIKKIKMSKF